MSRNIVLFLGAGFSKDAGLPTMSEFGKESTDQLNRLMRLDNWRDSSEYLINAGDIFVKFQKYCEKAKSFVNLNINNMEEIFCIAEAFGDAGIKELNLDGRQILVKDLLMQIKIWLWKIYQQCPPLNTAKNKNIPIETYDKFFDFLKDSKLSDNLTVLTTNYDLVFEYFAWKKKLPCIYPFETIEVESLDVYDKQPRKYYVSLSPNNEGPIICKLHGSINFFNLVKPPNFGISYDITKHGDSPEVPPDPRPAIFMLNAIWKLQEKLKKRNEEVNLAIIPPTYAKLQEFPWLRKTWLSSLQALENATHIIFIGYSIPESDGFIRAMINSAMVRRKDGLNLQVFVVNPDESTFDRYKRIFPSLYSSPENFVPFGFCEAWSRGDFLKILQKV